MAKRKLYPIDNKKAMLQFTLAGFALITLHSQRTQRKLTFMIVDPDRKQKRLKLPLKGPDRRLIYVVTDKISKDWDIKYKKLYVGYILIERQWMTRNPANGAGIAAEAFYWYWLQVLQPKKGDVIPNLKVYHEGRCGRCGNALTHPSSTHTGLGPICASANAYKWYKIHNKKEKE